VIGLVSKPPAPQVAAGLLAAAQATGKPIVVDFLGYAAPARRLGRLHFAASLAEAAQLAVDLEAGVEAGPAEPAGGRQPPISGFLRGLFSGGTLAQEALLGLRAGLAPLHANIRIGDVLPLADPLRSQGHTVLDLGEDVFTVGRLHPMIDNDLRLRRLRQEAADPEVGLILLDVVLGEGSHPDPASELAPAIEAARRDRPVEVVVILVGTDLDPQNQAAQAERLRQAGAVVMPDVTAAVDHVLQRLAQASDPAGPPVDLRALQPPVGAINVGLESFFASLKAQGAEAVHVDWRPPAGGDEKLLAILAKLK
jgi:FdrA protein